MITDDEKVLRKLEKAAEKIEKRDFKCNNCGSDHFKETNGWLECKYCKFICKNDTYKVKPLVEDKEYHVIKGPHTICSPYGVKGFTIPMGKYAIARLGITQDNKVDMIAALPIFFDDKEGTEKLAKAMRVKREEKAAKQEMEIRPIADEECMPLNIEPITNKEEVFDYGIVELTEPDITEEINNSWDRPRIVMFSCGECALHKTINTKYDKNFKIKEPCKRCGNMVKAELIA